MYLYQAIGIIVVAVAPCGRRMPVRSPTAQMFVAMLQRAPRTRSGVTSALRHLGVLGLFFLAILDSSPLPTFAGADILTAVLAARHRNPWYECAAVATAGSLIGAYITFRLARRAGSTFLSSKFGYYRVSAISDFFDKWGAGALAASTAIPFPFPTSLFFAAAGASNYPRHRFLAIVAVCRAMRYSAVAVIADHYGRHFVRVLRHPGQYWGWLLVFAGAAIGLILAAMFLKRRVGAESSI